MEGDLRSNEHYLSSSEYEVRKTFQALLSLLLK